jgi:hypothetical protein
MASNQDASATVAALPRHHRAESARRRRYQPAAVYALADHLKQDGVELDKVHGPWRAARRPLRRPGRNSATVIPIVTNGVAELAVDTPERAADLSGFLNWCGVDHLKPIPNLSPPSQDLLGD